MGKNVYINFSGKKWVNECVEVDIKVGVTRKNEIMLEASRSVEQVRDILLESEEKGFPLVTVIVPDNGVLSVAIIQAIRGLTGSIPFVQGLETEAVDTESIRESARDSLT
ncbi:hypothetical protein [Thermoactinomyces sp. DSM 45892]|uniref:hypothetical protein n=1 Tax=Thermoactinomyces sp. DSM 45892 TaxID=1882753 RepID=UPI00089D883F|nr:hypothetical protein [Thermoactinomyces sp. DSM 45892]SDY87123.1 hypothetical protein SAMN05444416_109128 [Thermoactinomyces sp. DSM 45892]